MHPFINIFGITIPGYGLLMAIGIIAAFVMMHFERKHSIIIEDDYYSALILAMVGGFVGSKLLYWLVEIDVILKNPHFLLESISSGFVFYGALIGGLLAIFFFTLKKKQNFLSYSDLFVPAVTLAQAFGRIGCYMAGCCYGKPYDGCCAVTFPEGVGSSAPTGVSLFPSQLLESAFLFVCAIILYLIFRKQKRLGTTSAWYLLIYSVGRFFIEFTRADYRGSIGPLSTSQFISVCLFILGIILMIFVCKKKTPICREPENEEKSVEEVIPAEVKKTVKKAAPAKKPAAKKASPAEKKPAAKKPAAKKASVAKAPAAKKAPASAKKPTAKKPAAKKPAAKKATNK